MARRFTRRPGGVGASFEAAEMDLLARLFADVEELLRPDEPDAAHPWAAELGLDDVALQGVGAEDEPAEFDDPALARLLPSGRRDDERAAAEFRRFTERGLRGRKRAALRSALSVLESWREEPEAEQVMSDQQARDWTTSLTDVRLVLAERLGIEHDADAEALHELDPDDLDPDEPTDWLAMVYDFVTWVQESVTDVLLQALPPDGDGRRRPPDV